MVPHSDLRGVGEPKGLGFVVGGGGGGGGGEEGKGGEERREGQGRERMGWVVRTEEV